MTQTSKYKLSQWAKSDRIQMEDFNSDNSKIEAALTALAAADVKIETGSYVGNGTFGPGHPTSITFSIVPKLVILFPEGAYASPGTVLCLTGPTAISTPYYMGDSTYGSTAMPYTLNGKTLSWYLANATDPANDNAVYQLNQSGKRYYYFAIG